jgi:hypothetical protein
MKRAFLLILIMVAGAGLFYSLKPNSNKPAENTDFDIDPVSENTFFELKTGDLLVRPNSDNLPGSIDIPYGRMYGHVGIVTEGASGNTIREVLEKAKVVEALFFDQATRELQWSKKNQIREEKAIVSFGNRFKGIRFRLRKNISSEQAGEMVRFARNQLDGGYNILSLKRKEENSGELKNEDWHCATLVWQAYYLTTGTDIDANGGILIYPSDIIANPVFDIPEGRIRF